MVKTSSLNCHQIIDFSWTNSADNLHLKTNKKSKLQVTLTTYKMTDIKLLFLKQVFGYKGLLNLLGSFHSLYNFFEFLCFHASSLHNMIFNSFCLILVLWSLLAKAKLSICDVIVVQKILVEMEYSHCHRGFLFLSYVVVE